MQREGQLLLTIVRREERGAHEEQHEVRARELRQDARIPAVTGQHGAIGPRGDEALLAQGREVLLELFAELLDRRASS